MSDAYKPGCCIDNACHPNMIGEDSEAESDCMRLPMGVYCGDCGHIARCQMLCGKKPTSNTCDWFPRKFWRAMT